MNRVFQISEIETLCQDLKSILEQCREHVSAMKSCADQVENALNGVPRDVQDGGAFTALYSLRNSLKTDRIDEAIQKLENCRESVGEGETFSTAAVQSGLLTGLYGRMLYIAERTGETDGALRKIAAQADEEVTMRIQNFISVLEPTLVAVLSVLVGGVLLSVMVPLMGILSNIG